MIALTRSLRRVVLLAVIESAASGAQQFTRPYRYEKSWEPWLPAESGGVLDTRAQFHACVENWFLYERVRSNVFQSLAAAGFDQNRRSMLLEIGGSGFSYYEYVAVVQGEVIDFGATGNGPINRRDVKRVAELTTAMSDEAIARLRGSVDTRVIDGPCYFLTITMPDGRASQAAVYGSLPSTATGRIIKTLLPYIRKGRPSNVSKGNEP